MISSTILIQNENETVFNMVDNYDGTFGIIIPSNDGIGGCTLTKEETKNLRDYLNQLELI